MTQGTNVHTIFAVSPFCIDHLQIMKQRLHAKRWHLWLGLPLCLFLFFASLSGIVLNHRTWWSHIDVPQFCLPEMYRFSDWKRGAVKTSFTHRHRHYLYGTAGIWFTTDSTYATAPRPFMEGMEPGSDNRRMVGMVARTDGSLWAASQTGLYRLKADDSWQKMDLPTNPHERMVDLQLQGDSLVLLSRSHIYVSLPGQDEFTRFTLPASDDYEGKISLFNMVWTLHSGEYFSLPGQLLVDAVGLIVMLLSVTGIAYFVLKRMPNKKTDKSSARKRSLRARMLADSYRWHERMGRILFPLLLFILVTGWMLRPPLMIPLTLVEVPPLLSTHWDTANPWMNSLQAIRYDRVRGHWLMATSRGFYTLPTLDGKPMRSPIQAPVSPMGMNMFHQTREGDWLIGSFSGLFRVQASEDSTVVSNFLTGERIDTSTPMRPVGHLMLSGYIAQAPTDSFLIFRYNAPPLRVWRQNGQIQTQETPFAPVPEQLENHPLSLWQVAIEIHTGRIYTPLIGQWGALLFVFILGLLSTLVLITGYRRRRKARSATHRADSAPK